jgi:hypothetical protein
MHSEIDWTELILGPQLRATIGLVVDGYAVSHVGSSLPVCFPLAYRIGILEFGAEDRE